MTTLQNHNFIGSPYQWHKKVGDFYSVTYSFNKTAPTYTFFNNPFLSQTENEAVDKALRDSFIIIPGT